MVAYVSTRGGAGTRSFEDVLLAGLAEDGGLFLPEEVPVLPDAAWRSLAGRSYADTAEIVLGPFVHDAIDPETFGRMVQEAYATFLHPATAPLVQLGPEDWLLELFHGPTLAFKDFALQLLARVFEHVLARRRESVTIVGATSGDTGSAAIAAFAGRANMRIVILHPHQRVSAVQRRQMTTVLADNVTNIAVEGTFDDCQELVKRMFVDAAFRKEQRLAAINSINWLRVAAQTVYYAYAALRLDGLDRPLSFSVPTGNFGDVYAGYVARAMGLPVGRLLVATNGNDILARFLASGRYAKGTVVPTTSPSMDIQVASNFERLLFDIEGRDHDRLNAQMRRFAEAGELVVEEARLADIRQVFAGCAIDEPTVKTTIEEYFQTTGLVLDPHTAVAVAGARTALPAGQGPRVALATAHPAKFPDAVAAAIGKRPQLPPHMGDLFEREERYVVLPADLATLEDHIRRTA